MAWKPSAKDMAKKASTRARTKKSAQQVAAAGRKRKAERAQTIKSVRTVKSSRQDAARAYVKRRYTGGR
jgi:hypothetical protein